MGLIFASSKILNFARTYFREDLLSRIGYLRIFVNTNFHESAILRYFASTYICESTVLSFSRIFIFANQTSSNFSRGLNFANLTKIRENPVKVIFHKFKIIIKLRINCWNTSFSCGMHTKLLPTVFFFFFVTIIMPAMFNDQRMLTHQVPYLLYLSEP